MHLKFVSIKCSNFSFALHLNELSVVTINPKIEPKEKENLNKKESIGSSNFNYLQIFEGLKNNMLLELSMMIDVKLNPIIKRLDNLDKSVNSLKNIIKTSQSNINNRSIIDSSKDICEEQNSL